MEVGLAMAPPRVRLISCWSARWSRSRRAVAAETPNRVMMSSIWTLPSSMMMSRMAEWRSCRDISILLRVKGVVRDGESMGWDGACM